jgi:signal transduction histidine kinase/ligand-binding sensor domain-containing protein/DNA-binding response OmpR family regulator
VFHRITVEDGLNNSVVYDIIQDKNNFIWFATKDGLNKFDGYQMQSYSLSEQAHQNSLDNIVQCLTSDENKNLYCGTSSGRIYQYDYKKNQFTRINIVGPNPIISPVYDLNFADSNNLIISSASGLFALNLQSMRVTLIGGINQIVQKCYIDSENIYWVGTAEGLYKGHVLFDSLLVASHLVKVETFADKHIFSINEDANNSIWIGTRRSGLFSFDKKNNEISSLNNTLYNEIGAFSSIRSIINSPEGNIIVAIDGSGIGVFDTNYKVITSFSHSEDVPTSLSSNGVYSLYFDNDQSLWVSTYGGGVNRYNPHYNRFVKYSHHPYNNNSLINNTARSVYETKDKTIWFGTKKGVSILNRTTGEWKHMGLNLPGEDESIVLSIDQASNGFVYIGTYNNGLIRVNPNNLTFKKITPKDPYGNPVGTSHIYSVMIDQKDRIWFGGILGGLSVIDSETHVGIELPLQNVKTIKESSWGKVYVGTLEGVFIVDMQTLTAERPKPANVLLNQNRFFCIYIDSNPSNRTVWLGTEGGGLLKWNTLHKTIQSFSTENGLPSNFIYGIVPDDKNNLWLSTTNGVCKFPLYNHNVRIFSIADGLTDQEFNFGAYGKTSNNEIIFGGQNGFTLFNPENTLIHNSVPMLVFNSFKLFGEEQEINTPNSPIKQHINTLNGIELSHRQNSVTLGFSAINFESPDKIQYRWRLRGFEEDWSTPSYHREAVYTNLKHGSYKFEVVCSNPDGIWSTHIKQLDISIKPPFWQTPWAYLLYSLTIGAIMALFMQMNRIRVKEKHAIEKTRFFINIAHDLRTPLTLIKAPLEQLSSSRLTDRKDAGSLLLARKNIDRLNRLVTQLMDFQKADLGKMELHPTPNRFVEFVKETAASFIPLIEEKELKIHYNFPEDDFILWFDKNKMEKIIFNLLSNAIKYTPKKGEVELAIYKEKSHCFFNISDSGVGIPMDQQKKIFTRYFRAKNVINSQETGSGVGLMLVKKLIELHKGSITFNSIESQGTTFNVKFPFVEYHNATILPEEHKKEPIELFKRTDLSLSVEQDDANNKYKVLIVEDNEELMDFMSGILSKYFNVTKAANGKEGLISAKQAHPDLIISDIMMPIMDGNQMTQKLKSDITTCHIPLILLTALNTLEYRIEGLNIGADAYIEKPFDINYLVAQINNLLSTRNRLKEKYTIHASVPESKVTYNDLDGQFLAKAKNYVLDNIGNHELSVEMLAGELAMSRPVLYRKLKALTDQSPQDYIRLIRLQEAKKLLKTGNQNITEIAFETGFSDPKYFSTSFKKLFGKTPSQFIKE